MQNESKSRLKRRHLGHLAARLDELPLHRLGDPRKRKGKWQLATLVRAALVGLASGRKGLADTEHLTDWLEEARTAVG